MTVLEMIITGIALLGVAIALAAHAKASAPSTPASTPATVDHVGIINAVANVVAAGQGTPPPVLVAAPPPAAVTFNPDNYPDPGARYLAWQAAGKPLKDAQGRELSVSGSLTAVIDSGGAASSFGPLAAFTAAYQHGRWTFKPNESVTVPIVAPSAGPFHFACSGSGGIPGGDSSVRLSITITDATGAVVGGGGDNPPYASFTAGAAGERYFLAMTAPAATAEDVTFAPGLG